MWVYRQLEVTTGEWWAGLAEWVIKLSVIVAAITLLLRTPIVSRMVFRVGHWLWNFPLISMTVEGLRDLVASEVETVGDKIDDISRDVADFRAERIEQHNEVTSQIARLADRVEAQSLTVAGHTERIAAVEAALMNRRRRRDDREGGG